jgi:hypothetical protein
LIYETHWTASTLQQVAAPSGMDSSLEFNSSLYLWIFCNNTL